MWTYISRLCPESLAPRFDELTQGRRESLFLCFWRSCINVFFFVCFPKTQVERIRFLAADGLTQSSKSTKKRKSLVMYSTYKYPQFEQFMKIVTSKGSQLFKTDKKLLEIRVSVARPHEHRWAWSSFYIVETFLYVTVYFMGQKLY